MLYLLLGKSASGKTTILNTLMQDKEFSSQVTELKSHTTRPIRPNEIDGREYIFDTVEQFREYLDNNEILEYAVYTTTQGVWFYYTLKKDLVDGKMIKIMNPIGFTQIKQSVKDVISFYIHVEDEERLRRLSLRGDDEKEITRRFKADEEDFEYLNTNYIITNDEESKLEERIKLIKDIILKGE